ncbi:MAG: phage integrase SAM-like domain-containing protein, partial [Longispora sp.]|nr:phage integrase SAM-like domain-containing protein [Longispora sp. (in: high G+C Gram-positive bacteria)]
WLTHWVENIAPLNVRENTLRGYSVAIRVHLIPGVGAHRLGKLQPEHLEKLYRKMQDQGSAPATAHQAHRTIRTALNQAVRRGYLIQNPAQLAVAPQLDDEEIEPYTIEEVQRLLATAAQRRNHARWVFALALGLRQSLLVKGFRRVRAVVLGWWGGAGPTSAGAVGFLAPSAQAAVS